MTFEDHATQPGAPDEGQTLGPPSAPLRPHADTNRTQPCLVPELIGLEAFGAHALASTAGVRLSVSVWQTLVGPWGLVLEQLLQPGARVRRGTRLHVIVSGRPHQPVPDVRGLSLEAAIEQLSWLGFIPLTTARLRSHEHPVGQVIEVRPTPGTVLAHGSVVALSVASSTGKPVVRQGASRPSAK